MVFFVLSVIIMNNCVPRKYVGVALSDYLKLTLLENGDMPLAVFDMFTQYLVITLLIH